MITSGLASHKQFRASAPRPGAWLHRRALPPPPAARRASRPDLSRRPRPVEDAEPSAGLCTILDASSELAPCTDIVFLDPAAEHAGEVVAWCQPGARVVRLDPDRDGIEQIAQHLRGHTGIDNLVVATGGAKGEIRLGNARLTIGTLYAYDDQFARIGRAMAPSGSILLLRGDTPLDVGSRALLGVLTRLTGVNVVAGHPPPPQAFAAQATLHTVLAAMRPGAPPG